MTIKLKDSIDYWDKEWVKRIQDDNHVLHNVKKAKLLIGELWSRPEYFKLKKLEIGCGTGFHIIEMAKYCDLWRDTWTGIDVSKEGIRFAKKHGLSKVYFADIEIFDVLGIWHHEKLHIYGE